MRTFQDAKIMAKALREELSRRDVALSHGECLHIVARQFGLDNWNVLAAKLDGAGRGRRPDSVETSSPRRGVGEDHRRSTGVRSASDSPEKAFEMRDGKLTLRQVEVPGHPGFSMFATANESGGYGAEREYRTGYFQAISSMLTAVQSGGKFNQGHQHALVDVGRLMKEKGYLSASDLEGWVSGRGSQWLGEVRTDFQVLPPALGQQD